MPFLPIVLAVVVAIGASITAGYYRGYDAAERKCAVERRTLENAIESKRVEQERYNLERVQEINELKTDLEMETIHAQDQIDAVESRNRGLAAEFDKLRGTAEANRRRCADRSNPATAVEPNGTAESIELSGADVEFLTEQAAEADRNTLKLIQLQRYEAESRRYGDRTKAN